MSADRIEKAAIRIRTAAETATPCAPIRDLVPNDDTDAAYAVQEQNTRHRLSQGGTLVGRKIGLTSAAIQKQLGVDQPDYGMLFADMRVTSGDEIAIALLLQPRVEAEIAFVLSDDLE